MTCCAFIPDDGWGPYSFLVKIIRFIIILHLTR